MLEWGWVKAPQEVLNFHLVHQIYVYIFKTRQL